MTDDIKAAVDTLGAYADWLERPTHTDPSPYDTICADKVGDIRKVLSRITRLEADNADRLAGADADAFNMGVLAQQNAALTAERDRLREALQAIDAIEPMEINPSNYSHDDVCELNANAVQAALIARAALEGRGHG